MNFCTGWSFCKDGGSPIAVNLPHDAMLTEQRDFCCHNGKQSGYYPGGKYHYEKTFTLDEQDIIKDIGLFFEGVYQNCRVLLNGQQVGAHKYGYTEFYVPLNSAARPGINTVVVLVDNSLEPNCRWYSGSGIYRPVHLVIREKDAPKQLRILTKSCEPAVITVLSDAQIIEIYDGEQLITSGQPGDIAIPNAHLWSTDNPYLYTCIARTGKDALQAAFGIRQLTWDARKGLCVNGQRVLLRGGCIHHDNGILGACEFPDAAERRVRIMKKAGYNALRIAHNPASRALLDACDKLGMYVMDEAFDGWYTPKNYHDYSRLFIQEWRNDLKAMVDKDFNHPSVIMYSIGNEVSETASQKGVETAGEMTTYMHTLDISRPVTAGINVLLNVYNKMGMGVYKDKGAYKAEPLPPKTREFKEKASGSNYFNMMAQKLGGLMFFMSGGHKGEKASAPVAEKLDIIGFNYAGSRFAPDLKKYPDRLMVASETMVTDLPYNWSFVKKYPAILGDFVWAAWDYLGEAGIGDWTYHSYKGLPLLAGSGTIDSTGVITAEAYFQQVVWGLRKKPYIGVQPLNHAGETPSKSSWRFTNALGSWTWHGFEGTKATVEVYAQGNSVRLLCNGQEVGTKKLRDFRAAFICVYQPGTLEAIALDEQGRELSRHSLRTGGAKTILRAIPEKTTLIADGQSLCYLPIEFTDMDGNLKPAMEQEVHIEVKGAVTLQGFGSALAKTDETYDRTSYHSYRGRALAVLRAGTKAGSATVTVTTKGFEPVLVKLRCE